LIPLTQHVLEADIAGTLFYVFFAFFAMLLAVSMIYLVRLLLPVELAYLDPPRKYYETIKSEIEPWHVGDQQIVDDSLKGSYILELENAIDINSNVFRRKSSFFYNALIFAILAVIPYIVCVAFHLYSKDSKVELVDKKKS